MTDQPSSPRSDYQLVTHTLLEVVREQVASYVRRGYTPGQLVAAGSVYVVPVVLTAAEIERMAMMQAQRRSMESVTGMMAEQINLGERAAQQMTKLAAGMPTFEIPADAVNISKDEFGKILNALTTHFYGGDEAELVKKIRYLYDTCPE